ncbi:C69 family dipeptidase [Candidatus Neomarinimicrobiota bacterium]
MCDTFVAMPSMTHDGSVIFGKNSDREPNEAQVLEYHPEAEFSKGKSLKCTYSEIPQISKTNAVLISRPFWMWGAEIGANDKGVVIGNEAVFTKMSTEKNGQLTGMDLLRLALERADTSQIALEIIIELLADFGQGGPCGFEDKKLTYHNSFIIADSAEAWVLETSSHLWVAKKVQDYYAISNGLTIGEEYDLSHPDLINYAKRKGWLKKGQIFNFAECYSDWFYTTFSRCNMRRRSSSEQLNNNKIMDVLDAFSLLRDHGSSDYAPDSHFLMNHVCAHSANKIARNASQSTASMVASLKNDECTYWATGTSAPCTSIFKPIRFDNDVLPDLGPNPTEQYFPNSLWWEHEKLHRTILQDFRKRHQLLNERRNELEIELYNKSLDTISDDFIHLTKFAFEKSKKLEDSILNDIINLPIEKKSKCNYRRYWKAQNEKAELPVN